MAWIRSRRALLLLIATVASACATPKPDGGAPTRGGEVVASLRSEPGNYNRYFEATAPADLVSLLTHARLVRVNRVTDNLEPALAESWTASPDGLTYTLTLRRDVRFSDGAPFTSADVLFSFEAAYLPESTIRSGLLVGGRPLQATSGDPHTVVVRFPERFAPGLRLLDILPILPRHKLQSALDEGTIGRAWTPSQPLTAIAGLGPFVLTEHLSGQRMVFTRNPHYWRRAGDTPLPYVDKLTVEIVPSQETEALRLESGAIDLMSNADIRPEDHARFRRLSEQGRLRLIDGGIGLDPNVLWFNLTPRRKDPKPWLRTKEFRQALSHAADRTAIANTVYLGAAVPVYGPITPRNTTWYSEAAPNYPHDPAKARQLLAAAGLVDRNGDGMLEDSAGAAARFSILVFPSATIRERTVTMLQEQFRRVGVGVDVVGVDMGSMIARWSKGDYEAIFHGWQASATDQAMNLDFWLSSGSSHYWNPRQPQPATPWEARIDELMQQYAASADLAERQRLFAEVQRIIGEEQPALYFVAPKVTIATTTRVLNPQPAPQIPQLLWSADSLAVSGPRR